MKTGNWKWAAILVALLAGATVLTGMASIHGSTSDRATFEQIIRDVAVLAESVHARGIQQYKEGTLSANMSALRTQGAAELNRLFMPDLANRLTETWVNENLNNSKAFPFPYRTGSAFLLCLRAFIWVEAGRRIR